MCYWYGKEVMFVFSTPHFDVFCTNHSSEIIFCDNHISKRLELSFKNLLKQLNLRHQTIE